MSLPPQQLSAPSPMVRTLLTPLWAALLVLAVVAQLGGTWRTLTNFYQYNPPFAALGLISRGAIGVEGAPGIEQTSSIPRDSQIYSIGEEAVDETVTFEQLSERLAGEMGSRVTVGFVLPDGSYRDLDLERSDANYRIAAPVWLTVIDRILLPLLGALAAGFGLYVSVLLWRRREDGVAQLLALGLIFLVLTGVEPDRFAYYALNDSNLVATVSLAAFLSAYASLIVAIPAFPDGRYWPAWSGWLAIVTPIFAIASLTVYITFAQSEQTPLLTVVDYAVSWHIIIALMVLAVFAAWLRFRATPPGLEKQQAKWAALGIIFGLLAIAFSEEVLGNIVIGGPAQVMIDSASSIICALGMIAIPLGLMMSLLGLRLNDADGAIGRSAGYAAITLLIGAIWAASTTWINRLIGDQLAPAAAAGISTMVAAAIFVPTRERILKWTEKRFQPALVKLRGLPAKLLPWRDDHNPADVARGTLLAIVNGVQASSAALILDDEGAPRVLATYEADEQAALADISHEDPDARAFPVHLRLDDLVGPIGFLLIGPRSDGASYNSDEKSALKLVAGPLAEVLRATSRRAGRNLALTEMLTAVDARVARLEALKTAV